MPRQEGQRPSRGIDHSEGARTSVVSLTADGSIFCLRPFCRKKQISGEDGHVEAVGSGSQHRAAGSGRKRRGAGGRQRGSPGWPARGWAGCGACRAARGGARHSFRPRACEGQGDAGCLPGQVLASGHRLQLMPRYLPDHAVRVRRGDAGAEEPGRHRAGVRDDRPGQ